MCKTKILTLLITAILLQGCGAKIFVSPKENPIIEDKVGENLYRTMATTSERRIVIVNDSLDPNYRGLYCAEPSPDSADNLASSFSSYLKASEGTGAASASAGIDKAFATTVEKLGRRSQGLQLFRDGSYSLCQAFMNGIIDKLGYIARLDELLSVSKGLIDIELRYKDSVIAPVATQEKTPKQLLDEQRAMVLTGLQAKTGQKAEKDILESAQLTAELERRKKEETATLEAAKSQNAIMEEQKRHELAILEKELSIWTKKAEIAAKKKELDSSQ